MKKRLFMIIAVMTIIAMAVVGLVACIDNNGGGNNGGSDNGDNNNGGDNTEVETPITETAGLNINNFRNELATKSLTLKYTENSTISGMSSTKVSILEYEPTKWKQTQVINGKNIVDYLYKLGDKYVRVDADLNVYNNAVNDALAIVTMFIAPNASDLFDLKSGKYSVKTDKFVDYYYKIFFDTEVLPSEGEWNFYKLIFESLRIEFMSDSISVSFASKRGADEAQAIFEITKIGNTSVVIPQEILDLPVHGLTIDRLSDLRKMSYTANLIIESAGEVVEDSFVKFNYEQGHSCLSSYLKGSNDMLYVWENENKYYIAMQENDIITKEETVRDNLYGVVEMIENIVGNHFSYFELIDGRYVVSESNIDNYIESLDLQSKYKNDMDAARAHVRSIEFTLGKDIILTYTDSSVGAPETRTLILNDFYSTTTSVPDSIINMPVTNSTI